MQYDGNCGIRGEIMDKAWNNAGMAESIINQEQVVCCGNHHLPNNEKDPYSYKEASERMGQVPFAGKNRI